MRQALGLFCCLSIALTAGASSAGTLRDENVLTPVPAGFKVGYHTVQGPMVLAEYVPQAETVNAWSSMITVQIFHGQGGRDPDAFAQTIASGWQGACANSTVTRVVGGAENGYPFAVWAFECPLNRETGKPENMWLKAVGGADALYSVQYADRAPMSPALIKPAMSYLRQVKVCDTRRKDRACPAGM